MNRLFANICSSDIEKSRDFYISLFDFKVNFDSDWYVHLVCSENEALELGIMDKNYDLVPESFNGQPSGLYVTFVIDDVNTVFEKAKNLGYEIVQTPEPTFYGQNRMLLKDPDGLLVDVSSLLNT